MFNAATAGSSVIFLATLCLSLLGLFLQPKIIERSLFRPYWFLRKQQYDTVISSGLVHADLPHLIFNMLTFYFFAFALERRIGSGAFVLLYLLALVLSELSTFIKHRNNPHYATLGASGAITAVLFASIVYFPAQSLFILPFPFPIPAPLFAISYLAFTYYSARQDHGRINHDAHLGGAITGLLFVAVTEPSAYRHLLRILD